MGSIFVPFGVFCVCAAVTVLLQLYIGSLDGSLDRNPDQPARAKRLAFLRRLVVYTAIGAGASLVIAMIAGAYARGLF